jgi:hypothetical protein
VRTLKIDLPGDSFSRAFDRFQALANDRREIVDADLREICDGALKDESARSTVSPKAQRYG